MAPHLQRLRLGDDEQHFGSMEAFLMSPIYEHFFALKQELYFKLMAFMTDEEEEEDLSGLIVTSVGLSAQASHKLIWNQLGAWTLQDNPIVFRVLPADEDPADEDC